MPIYAYRCEACGHAKDALQKVSDPALTVCPSCGAPSLRKQVTAAGFQLKGSGWYVTDFRGNGNGAAKAKEDGAKPADGKADGTADGAKPAATPAAAAGGSSPAAVAPTGGGSAASSASQ